MSGRGTDLSGAALESLAQDLWVCSQPLRFFGVGVGTRMSVIRLAGSRLLLHSPVSCSPEIRRAVESIGEPAFVVAPNRFHHLYVGQWQRAFPSARVFLAPGLAEKRPDLAGASVLASSPEPEWSQEVDQLLFEGFPLANEVVFFHRASATLLTSDLVFHIGPTSPLATRLAFLGIGAYGRPASTLLERLFVRDRAAFRRSLERVLAWPFDRIVLAHGEVVETGGRAALASAYSWILGEGASAAVPGR